MTFWIGWTAAVGICLCLPWLKRKAQRSDRDLGGGWSYAPLSFPGNRLKFILKEAKRKKVK